MSRLQNHPDALLTYLQNNGPTLSSEVVDRLGISRSTLSRRVDELGDRVIRIGKARATKLAARHAATSASVPLYTVDDKGKAHLFGHLTALMDGERTQWLLEAENASPNLLSGEFKEGLFPGWPWFMEDLRPAGFLGRAFGKRMAQLFQLQANPDEWSALELLSILTAFGSNLPGNFILGDGRALSDFQEHKIATVEGYYRNTNPDLYPEFAQRALEHGEDYGSSAGGEQPKFTSLVCDTPEAEPRAVIVKFSPKTDSASGRRWADLLYAEHIAHLTLAKADIPAARTRVFYLQGRVFLESERFDRVGASGRRGVISLRAMDAAHLGMGDGSWADCARMLHKTQWISAMDCERRTCLHCFGKLIANTDMHWGNLSFFLPTQSYFPLAPVYDMLPMHFRPSGTGEVIDRTFNTLPPKPEDTSAWLTMYPYAFAFWQSVIEHKDISRDFKAHAAEAIKALKRIHKIATS